MHSTNTRDRHMQLCDQSQGICIVLRPSFVVPAILWKWVGNETITTEVSTWYNVFIVPALRSRIINTLCPRSSVVTITYQKQHRIPLTNNDNVECFGWFVQ